MSWHYVAVKKVVEGYEQFEIHEAYPDLCDPGGLLPITENSVSPYGDTLDGLEKTLMAMLDGIRRHPVVDDADYNDEGAGE